jgi:O-acetylserine/cysteine efflux transporter
LTDGLLALLVMAVWGTNFVVIKFALGVLPPLLFAALRFMLVCFPAILFLKRPAVPLRHLAAYGVLIGAGQFGLLYIAMTGAISPGLASLVVQTQVVFTIGLSMIFTGDKIRPYQIGAVILAGAGIVVIATHAHGSATPLGLALVIGAALSWAGGNVVARQGGRVNMLAYVVWSSLFSVPPLIALSLFFEGPAAIAAGLSHLDAGVFAAVVWQSVGNTMFGYSLWAWLLSRHPAATVSPMALLVPVFGMGASALLLGEPLQDWKLLAAFLVLGGLAINFFWPLIRVRFAAAKG